MSVSPIYSIDKKHQRVNLYSPTALPKAGSFLWNSNLLVQVNCRGFVSSQFMQLEPSKYSYGPNIEATTFMMPEHHFYTHHPGRYFYIKDEESGDFFSAPYEPVRQLTDKYVFSAGLNDIRWYIEHLDLAVEIEVSLAATEMLERWRLSVKNIGQRKRQISIYPYFSVGYMSWMNQSATYNKEINAIVASSIRPYQKLDDYFKQQKQKSTTFLLASEHPESYCVSQSLFEGEGGLHNPDGIQSSILKKASTQYEPPVAVLQYRPKLSPQATESFEFLFGPARDTSEVKKIKEQYFEKDNSCSLTNIKSKSQYQSYLEDKEFCIKIESCDEEFDFFINHWLPRQIFYHGDANRLTSDPQTRNFLQDHMGMSYLDPVKARDSFLKALKQQYQSGEMPDGILLHDLATLKYINQVPHNDHCIWLPLFLSAYLDEHNDYQILDEEVSFADSKERMPVYHHVNLAMEWLLSQRDPRGLSYIAQGDWCDPMNMVGHKGKGVSAWLSLATIYALKVWLSICEKYGKLEVLSSFGTAIKEMEQAVNNHCWSGEWYARGITDDNRLFGVAEDKEGRIYLNPQSWAILSGVADSTKQQKILQQIDKQLNTPDGVMMLAPSYTCMQEDIGRITQKSPGVAENGSIYNHAAIFYAYSLYQINEFERAFEVLKKMIPESESILRRGQLPTFIPNYYRGAYYQYPDSAGRSSQLFNTGTVAWFYRCVIEELCGLKGDNGDLLVSPKLPKSWPGLKITRRFAGATFNIEVERCSGVRETEVIVDGALQINNRISQIKANKTYQVKVKLSELAS